MPSYIHGDAVVCVYAATARHVEHRYFHGVFPRLCVRRASWVAPVPRRDRLYEPADRRCVPALYCLPQLVSKHCSTLIPSYSVRTWGPPPQEHGRPGCLIDPANQEIQAASQINQNLHSAAPGSAPIIEAQADAWLVRANAYTQAATADLMRVRAIDLADAGASVKSGATNTANLGQQLINLLQRH